MDNETIIQYILLITLVGFYILYIPQYYKLIPGAFYEKDSDTRAWSIIGTLFIICITVGLGIHIGNMNTMNKVTWNISSGIAVLFCFYLLYRNKESQNNTTYIYVNN